MSNIDFKEMKKEFDYEKEKNNFSVEDFLKENEEKLKKLKEWESTQKFVSSFEDYLDGDKNDKEVIMSNIDFKEMKKHMESLTEEDKKRMREEHEKKLQRWNELAKTHTPIILSDDRRRKNKND